MSRNKTAKRTAKRQTINFATSQKIEKDFLEAPAKLSTQLNKDIVTLKQKENKIKSAINKIKAQIKNSENRVKAASKVNTAAGKKQLNTLKKNHNETIKSENALNKELNEIAAALEMVTNKHAKIIAWRKHLSQFEKDWAQNVKKQKAKAKIVAKAKPKKTVAKEKPMQAPVEQPQFESFEETMSEPIRQNEMTEATS